MALIVKDRVQESSTTAGTGTLTLSGATSGFQTFSTAIGNGNLTYYAIVEGALWEVGLGTVGAGTLARTTLLSSSTGSLVAFTSASKNVFVTYPAGRSVYLDETLTANAPQLQASNGLVLNSKTISTSFTIPSADNAHSVGPITIASGVTITVPSGSRWMIN